MELLYILFGTFFVLLLFGIPIAVSLGIAGIAGMFYAGVPLMSLPQRMFVAVDSFTFLAVPFFILAGKLMETGGISRRLIDFANDLLSFVRGGLAMAAVAACTFFASLTGSANGTVAAICAIMYPEMVKKGYNKDFTAGLIVVSGGLGAIIPPSIVMITLGVTTGISISAMFMGGMLVGLLLAVIFCVSAYVICRVKGYGADTQGSVFCFKKLRSSAFAALPAFGMPIIILGGIYGGIFTPTEAAAVSVVYAIFVGAFVYKELTFENLGSTFFNSGVGAAAIMFIVAASQPFTWIFARQGLATQMVNFMTEFFASPLMFFIAVFFVMIILGTFIEGLALILLLMPFLFPVSQQFGIDPVHFGVIMTLALAVGTASPPVAVSIFVATGATGLPMQNIVRGMMPIFTIFILVSFLLIFFPGFTTWLPTQLGLIR